MDVWLTDIGLDERRRGPWAGFRHRLRDADAVGVEAASLAIDEGGTRHRWQLQPMTLLLAGDVLMLVVSTFPAVLIGGSRDTRSFGWAACYAVLCLVVLRARGFYRFRLGAPVVAEVGRIITATALAAMLVICARSFLVGGIHVGLLGARLWVFSTLFLSLGRVAVTREAPRLRGHALALSPTLVVGAGNVGRVIGRRLRDRPEFGLLPVGHLDDDPRPGSDDDLPVLGGIVDLDRVVLEHRVSHVVIGFSLATDGTTRKLMQRCIELGTQVLVVPRLYEEMTQRLTIEHLGAIPLLRVEQPDPAGWQFAIKYALDRVVAAVLIVFLAPVLAAIALLVKRSTDGPILFRQKRVSRDGQAFTMLKFRSMRGEPDEAGEADARWAAAVRGDPAEQEAAFADRTTRVGGILRQRSLDELPQLFNVLRGEMSIIGPRPERVGYAREFESLVYRYGDRYRVKSGITGWAQVQGLRGETSLSDRVEWDNFYIENWSPWLDLKILFMTFPVFRSGLAREAANAAREDSPRAGSALR